MANVPSDLKTQLLLEASAVARVMVAIAFPPGSIKPDATGKDPTVQSAMQFYDQISSDAYVELAAEAGDTTVFVDPAPAGAPVQRPQAPANPIGQAVGAAAGLSVQALAQALTQALGSIPLTVTGQATASPTAPGVVVPGAQGAGS